MQILFDLGIILYMLKNNKILFQKNTIFVILFFALFYSILTFLIIPSSTSFLKYPLLAQQYVKGTLEINRIPDLSPMFFYLNTLVIIFTKSIAGTVKIIQIIQVFLISFSTIFLFHTLRFFFLKF